MIVRKEEKKVNEKSSPLITKSVRSVFFLSFFKTVVVSKELDSETRRPVWSAAGEYVDRSRSSYLSAVRPMNGGFETGRQRAHIFSLNCIGISLSGASDDYIMIC